MLNQSRTRQIVTHAILIVTVIVICFPLYFALVAASHSNADLMHAPLPLLPGRELLQNLHRILLHGNAGTAGMPVWPMLINSFYMALIIAIGKVTVSILSAYAIVYFDFPCKKLCFWIIFMTLMLPVEVRILPTFQVAANLNLLNSYAGLTLPLLASATATFLFRQFFLTIPSQLVDAAKLDGAGVISILWDIIIPLSRTNIAALFTIMFIYGWNQYLWPLVITTNVKLTTIVMGMQRLANVADQIPRWNEIMAMALLALIPPAVIVVIMQKLFMKGLIQVEK